MGETEARSGVREAGEARRHATSVEAYAFLSQRNVDRATLRRAAALAIDTGVTIHDVLISIGWITEADYVDALSRYLAIPVAPADAVILPAPGTRPDELPDTATIAGDLQLVGLRATAFTPAELAARFDGDPSLHARTFLLSTARLESAVVDRCSPDMLHRATHGLHDADPDVSARRGTIRWQQVALATLTALPIAGLAASPDLTADLLSLGLALPFFCVVLLRGAAVLELLRPPSCEIPRSAALSIESLRDDTSLPVYSILVPLYREAEVLPRLVQSLMALDYPSPKLDIMLVLESSDEETRAAAEALYLPGCIRIVVVPPGTPRTKPKALNYALQLARGDYVVVFDAEDRPEPGQLRAAIARFARGEPGLACVQARLNIRNPDASLLTRQFTLEYSVLFDATLPALERLGLPVPLGGTSNHFPVDVLREIGGWDPYNVTEDADLGIRLARRGLHTATIETTTWEEAPPDFRNWLTQRTRWLKGWMQTWLVHVRRPVKLWRDLGTVRVLGLHVFMGGVLLSVLSYPLFWLMLAIETVSGRTFGTAPSGPGSWLWLLTGANLVLGFTVSMLAGVIAAHRRQRPWLAPWVLAMPVYWLLISAAGYRALWQLARQPFLWEKTKHGRRR